MDITPVVFDSHFGYHVGHSCFLRRLFLAYEVLFDFTGPQIIQPADKARISFQGRPLMLERPTARFEQAILTP